MKKVSIIIPNYNGERWLSACIQSCIQQEGDFEKEIIIVDDQSSDSSWTILEEWQKKIPEEIFLYKNASKGGNNARNLGFSKSTGNYIQWLDSDDILLEGKLKIQLEFLEKNPDVDIVYSDWRMDFYNEQGFDYSTNVKEKEYPFFLKELIEDNWRPPLSYLIRREWAERLHVALAWNPSREVAQDREYFSLAAIYGARFRYTQGMFSVYNRWSKSSVSSIEFKKRLELNLALEFFLIKEIQKQNWLSDRRKKQLVASLKTDALKACYYFPSLNLKTGVGFYEIKWKRIHFKMRALIPFVWLYQMFIYLIKGKETNER